MTTENIGRSRVGVKRASKKTKAKPKRVPAAGALSKEAVPIPTSDEGLTGRAITRQLLIAELEQRAESGDGAAASLLGDHYKEGDVVSQDLDVAFRWYSRGAELGDREAQNNLGSMFLNGLGSERNPAQAIYWYRKSAEQGQPVAQYNLAKRYYHGDGIDQDYAEAYKWFAKAAVQGETWASCEMGTIHRFGHGVERNLLAAADFHLIAAEAGDEVACGNLSDYKAELEDIALSGSQLASLYLCRMYNRGFGAGKSQPMTWAWISWAKKHCSRDTDAGIAQEVSEAYDFYHTCVTSETRKHGERSLAGLRAVHTKRTNKSGDAKKDGTRRHRTKGRP